MKKSLIIVSMLTLIASFAAGCSSAKKGPEEKPTAQVVETSAPADLGASSSGRGL